MNDTEQLKELKDDLDANYKRYSYGYTHISPEGLYLLNCVETIRGVLVSIDERLKKVEAAE